MKKTSFVFILVLLIVSTTAAQAPDTVWTRILDTEGFDDCTSVVFTFDSCLVMTGSHRWEYDAADSPSDATLRKVGSDGETVWYHGYDVDTQDQMNRVVETPDHGLAALGRTTIGSTSVFAPLILKTDSDGVELWHRDYAIDGYSVNSLNGMLTEDGGFLLVGSSKPEGAGDSLMNGMMLKVNSEGVQEWYHEYGGTSCDVLHSVIQTGDGGYVATGTWRVKEHVFPLQGWLLKVDMDGAEVWSTQFSDSNSLDCHDLIESPEGDILVCGERETTCLDAGFGCNNTFAGFLARFSSGGDSLDFHTGYPMELLHDIMPVYSEQSPSTIVGYCLSGGIYQQGGILRVPCVNKLICINLASSMEWCLELDRGSAAIPTRVITEAWDGGCVLAGNTYDGAIDGFGTIVYRMEAPHLSGIGNQIVSHPTEFTLSNAWPNPFNPSTSITVSLPHSAQLKVAVYNLLGREVVELANNRYQAGSHRFVFDGSGLPTGIYFVRATAQGQMDQVRKVVLMK